MGRGGGEEKSEWGGVEERGGVRRSKEVRVGGVEESRRDRRSNLEGWGKEEE